MHINVGNHMRVFPFCLLIIGFFALLSCENRHVEPFEISVSDYNYSLAYSVLYRLNNEELSVTFRGELEGEKDSILFVTQDLPMKSIEKLSQIDISSLGVMYSNPCISDGDIKVFSISNKSGKKRIQLNNYYHLEISPSIDIINELVPENLKITHDKKDLEKWIEKCGDTIVRMTWNNN